MFEIKEQWKQIIADGLSRMADKSSIDLKNPNLDEFDPTELFEATVQTYIELVNITKKANLLQEIGSLTTLCKTPS